MALSSKNLEKDIHPVPELLDRREWLLYKNVLQNLSPRAASIFLSRHLFLFLFFKKNKIVLLHNCRTRVQTLMFKMQKVPYIQTSVAQKKHPLQHLNPLTLSSLCYMTITKFYWSVTSWWRHLKHKIPQEISTPRNPPGLILKAQEFKNFISTNSIFTIFWSFTSQRFSLYKQLSIKIDSPNPLYKLGMVDWFCLSVRYEHLI